MFPSPNPFESLFKTPSNSCIDHQNPNPKQDHDPPFLFNFPSPFFDEDELPLNKILLQSQLIMADKHTDPARKEPTQFSIIGDKKEADKRVPNGVVAPSRRRNLGAIPRRRTGKKDRHSKICTAQGIRDRRMRLSLQVARKFFDLQDLLGYDKASKTIEWLFTKSKKAIKELAEDHPHANFNFSTSDAKSHESFLSECEVVSGVHEENYSNEVKDSTFALPAESVVPLCINQVDDGRKSHQPACKPNTRESREKARARARCRTREKMMVKRLEFCGSNPTVHVDNLEKLGFSNSPFEGVDQESNSQNKEIRVSPYEAVDDCNLLEQQLSDVGAIQKFLASSSSSMGSCPMICDYQASAGHTDPNSNFIGFSGNWELMLNNERTSSSLDYAVTNQVSLAGNPNSIYSSGTDYY
ncbi:Transcription factor TCP12 [Sesamum alatum]|uniref:Transcription factor TCP12 n=1 Tax=Sesamum alatum TaxID=300844 RepID=A0AAE1Y4K8_9LAMI|nr:Transcription factor TCP12 [Sesamum alatum]